MEVCVRMKTREFIITQTLAHFVCGLFSLLAVLPFALLFIASFTNESWAVTNGYSYFPKEWSLEAYKYLNGRVIKYSSDFQRQNRCDYKVR